MAETTTAVALKWICRLNQLSHSSFTGLNKSIRLMPTRRSNFELSNSIGFNTGFNFFDRPCANPSLAAVSLVESSNRFHFHRWRSVECCNGMSDVWMKRNDWCWPLAASFASQHRECTVVGCAVRRSGFVSFRLLLFCHRAAQLRVTAVIESNRDRLAELYDCISR
jgi:hypothetical protein